MKKIFLIANVLLAANASFAQAPEKAVESFGEAMTSWCKTGDIEYTVQFHIDVNSKLTVHVNFDSLNKMPNHLKLFYYIYFRLLFVLF